MKKEEALEKAPSVSKVLMEYIYQMLSDSLETKGSILINSIKNNGQTLCTFEIDVSNSQRRFTKDIDTNITVDHIDVLTEQIFKDFIDWFLESEHMGVSKYYEVKGMIGLNLCGVSAVNDTGSKIDINFICRGQEFKNQVTSFNEKLDAYVKEHQEGFAKK